MSDDSTNSYQPEYVTPPGLTLADLLEERGIRQNELAVRMDVTPKFINEIIAGKASISPSTALSLERTLDVPADFWLGRDAHYQASRARASAQAELAAQAAWLDELPIKEMVKFGWIRKCSTAWAQVAECLRFFSVTSAAAWREQYVKRVRGAAAWRISEQVKHAEGAIATWLRQGEIEAMQSECAPFDRELMIRALKDVRALTLEEDPQKFIPELQKMLSACGVVVAFVRAPKGCPASGAVRWIAPQKALVQLSLRYKTNDHLWFTFFHECGHLLLHGKKMLFLEGSSMTGDDEEEANVFARERLIPQEKFEAFKLVSPSSESIEEFAKRIGIAAGIVLGRMQKEELVPWSKFNDLKVRYLWRESDE
jgi:HTH-type transcriptional regulator/antitoxin HigA